MAVSHKPSGSSATEALTRFVAACVTDDLPAAVRRECVRAFLNAIGCSLGGARHPMLDIAHRALSEFSGAPVASILGRGERADILSAALMNGLAGAAYSFDDTYSDALLHPVGPVAMALLAFSELHPTSGRDFVLALALGIEVACRLTNSVSAKPAEVELAWSQSGIACGAGAAMGVGKLLGLDTRQLSWALGLATSEASGTRVTHGSMAASLIFGHAAQTGLRSAILAKHGFTSSPGSIEGRYGFANVFAKKPNISALTDGLGQNFELMANSYKPFPCAVVVHPALDTVLQLKKEFDFSSDAIERIKLWASEGAMTLGCRPAPTDDLEAKFSVHHWVAVAAVIGRASIREGALEAVNNPEIVRIRGLIEIEADGALASGAARASILLRDGRQLTRSISHCIGTPERPMNDEELETKFLDQVGATVGRAKAEHLLARCWQVQELPEVGQLAREAC